MALIHGAERLEDFIRRHPAAESPLAAWRRIIERTKPKHYPELKATFPSASYARPHTIFNISGNKYRLIAIVAYAEGIVWIKCILTHQDYDHWSQNQRSRHD